MMESVKFLLDHPDGQGKKVLFSIALYGEDEIGGGASPITLSIVSEGPEWKSDEHWETILDLSPVTAKVIGKCIEMVADAADKMQMRN